MSVYSDRAFARFPSLLRRLGRLVLLLAAAAAVTAGGVAAQGVTTGSSGLPVPRFVSLKSDAVNVRRGPSREHEVIWRYVRAGLPVEVTQEFDNWRRIRDFEGAEGWVFHSLLAGTRTALVTPWDKTGEVQPVFADPSRQARITAHLQAGVQAEVEECNGDWCRLKGPRFSGWIEQPLLWGVYPNEVFD